jgi:hypothetical protein
VIIFAPLILTEQIDPVQSAIIEESVKKIVMKVSYYFAELMIYV